MPSNQDLFDCAERLSEEGRLLWVLGRSLARATNDPDGLGSWAIKTYRELQALELRPARTTSAPPRPVRLPAQVAAGVPVIAWVASSSRQQEWTSVAVGVDINGNKQLLAVIEGSTSDPMVCRHLVEAMTGESLRLLITDGSLTLDDTIKLRWDNPPKIAHCRTDTRKSVLAHLQGEKRRRVDDVDQSLGLGGLGLQHLPSFGPLQAVSFSFRVEHDGQTLMTAQVGEIPLDRSHVDGEALGPPDRVEHRLLLK